MNVNSRFLYLKRGLRLSRKVELVSLMEGLRISEDENRRKRLYVLYLFYFCFKSMVRIVITRFPDIGKITIFHFRVYNLNLRRKLLWCRLYRFGSTVDLQKDSRTSTFSRFGSPSTRLSVTSQVGTNREFLEGPSFCPLSEVCTLLETTR